MRPYPLGISEGEGVCKIFVMLPSALLCVGYCWSKLIVLSVRDAGDVSKHLNWPFNQLVVPFPPLIP